MSQPTNIHFDLLHTSASMKTMSSVVSTSIGPVGRLKLLLNSTGCTAIVTSSSSRLVNRLSVSSVASMIVCSSARSQLRSFNDNGLLCVALALNLFNDVVPLEYPLPAAGALIERLGRTYVDCLQARSNACAFDVDFSNLNHLRCLVDSVLSSKPGCASTLPDRTHLRNLLLKAFLSVVPSSEVLKDGNVKLLFSGGASMQNSCLYNGVLVRVPKAVHLGPGPFKTVLFAVSLLGEVPGMVVEATSDVVGALLEDVESVVDEVVTEGVQVVFCQKVVHPRLKKRLRDAKIVILDSIGAEAAKYVQYVSGGNSNSSLFSELKYGSISRIATERVGRDHYLLLCSDTLFSIVLRNFSEEAGQEMMVVCRQAIDSLFCVLRSSRLCFGAGCTEIHTAHLLAKKVLEESSAIQEEMGCSRGQLDGALKSFLHSIATTCVAIHQGSRLDFATETEFGHLWKVGEERCACGCVLSRDIPGSSWICLSDLEGSSATSPMATCDWKSVVVDELSCKVGSVSRSVETASLLLRTNLVVDNGPAAV